MERVRLYVIMEGTTSGSTSHRGAESLNALRDDGDTRVRLNFVLFADRGMTQLLLWFGSS